jgi:hypothetical protein
MILIAILSTVLWGDGWKSILTDEECKNENHVAYLRMESKNPALAAYNKHGKRTLEACYVDDRGLLIVVDDETVRIKAILYEEQTN